MLLFIVAPLGFVIGLLIGFSLGMYLVGVE